MVEMKSNMIIVSLLTTDYQDIVFERWMLNENSHVSCMTSTKSYVNNYVALNNEQKLAYESSFVKKNR